MLVWQSDGERWADTPTPVRSYEWREDEIFRRRGWQVSREVRVALEFAMAILSALGASYLILRLGL